MDWNDLRFFLAISDTGTLAGAARALAVNHSTVFRRLNALEADLDVRLFERVPEGYVLTPAGERMRELGRTADNAISDIERELAGRDLAPTGVVRLTTAPNLARTVVPEALRRLRRSYPGIVVEVTVGDHDYDLGRREADLALRATSSPPGTLIGRRLMKLDWWVCARKASRAKKPSSPAELAGHALIGADASMMRLKAFQWLADNFGDQIVARSNDLSTMAAMALAGIGLAVLPSDQTDPQLERLFRVPESGGELWLLTHPDLRNVRRIRAVWDELVVSTEALR